MAAPRGRKQDAPKAEDGSADGSESITLARRQSVLSGNSGPDGARIEELLAERSRVESELRSDLERAQRSLRKLEVEAEKERLGNTQARSEEAMMTHAKDRQMEELKAELSELRDASNEGELETLRDDLQEKIDETEDKIDEIKHLKATLLAAEQKFKQGEKARKAVAKELELPTGQLAMRDLEAVREVHKATMEMKEATQIGLDAMRQQVERDQAKSASQARELDNLTLLLCREREEYQDLAEEVDVLRAERRESQGKSELVYVESSEVDYFTACCAWRSGPSRLGGWNPPLAEYLCFSRIAVHPPPGAPMFPEASDQRVN